MYRPGSPHLNRHCRQPIILFRFGSRRNDILRSCLWWACLDPNQKEKKRKLLCYQSGKYEPFYHEQRIHPAAVALRYQDKAGPEKLKHLAGQKKWLGLMRNGSSFTGFLVQRQDLLARSSGTRGVKRQILKWSVHQNRTPWENSARREFTHCTFLICFHTYSSGQSVFLRFDG